MDRIGEIHVPLCEIGGSSTNQPVGAQRQQYKETRSYNGAPCDQASVPVPSEVRRGIGCRIGCNSLMVGCNSLVVVARVGPESADADVYS